MQVSFISSKLAKYALAAAASLMLAFVFTGCSAGPLQSHSAFKQSALPSGYQSAYQNQRGFGAQPSPQIYQGFRGGTLAPFAGGGNFSSGSC